MMPGNVIQDTYSNDDKTNEGFALPLAGRRRKAIEAGIPKPPIHHQQSKRQHL